MNLADYGSLGTLFAIAAALACVVVAWKSFDYVRENLRNRRDPRRDDRDRF